MQTTKRALFVFFALLLAGPFAAMAEIANDIAYGPLEKQKLDVYMPDGADNTPVMINVHGGGWHIGKKTEVQKKPKAFNRQGMLFVSVGYPLMPDHEVEVQAASIARAIAWVEQNIADYGGDPSRIYLMGHSAGAHLVSLVALDPTYLQNEGASPSLINGVVSVDGASLNLVWRMENLSDTGSFSVRMFSQTFGDDPARWRNLSPYHHISGERSPPPFLFLFAEKNDVSDPVADGVAARLREVGGDALSKTIKGRNHASINRRLGGWRDPAFAAIMSFLPAHP